MDNQKQYYYVQGSFQNRFSGRLEEGLLGPFLDYDSAMDTGYEKSMTDVKILTFPTQNLQTAVRIWKGAKVTSGQDWDIAVQKIRHSGKDIGVDEETTGSSYEPNLLE